RGADKGTSIALSAAVSFRSAAHQWPEADQSARDSAGSGFDLTNFGRVKRAVVQLYIRDITVEIGGGRIVPIATDLDRIGIIGEGSAHRRSPTNRSVDIECDGAAASRGRHMMPIGRIGNRACGRHSSGRACVTIE